MAHLVGQRVDDLLGHTKEELTAIVPRKQAPYRGLKQSLYVCPQVITVACYNTGILRPLLSASILVDRR